MTARPRRTGQPVEEAPGLPPKCPACGAVGVYHEAMVLGPGRSGYLLTWWWETAHDDDCAWLNDPNSEPY